MSQITVLHSGLREVVRELQGSRDKLVELRKEVPPAPPERAKEDLDVEPDPLSEMAAVIDCGLHDCLEPLIRDLKDAASYREAG